MCLIFIAVDQHPDYPLLVAANRDEFYVRETQPAHVWDVPKGLVAGKDLVGGGTWLGADEKNGIAMLTNFRDPSRNMPDAPTRGTLVTNYFQADGAEQYLEEVQRESNQYNGFNLICGNLMGLFYFGNYGEGIKRLEKGIHGLSNALLDDPWPKVEAGKKRMHQLIENNNLSVESFMALMADDHRAEDAELPETGVGKDLERVLSAMFIKSPNYGSRCTTVIRVNKEQEVEFVERTYNTSTFDYLDRRFKLQW